MEGKKRFLMNGAVLAFAALFMRTVSVSFNAYTVGKVGAEGIGLFTLTMSMYGFFLTLATSGVGLALTRLVADALGRGDGDYAGAMIKKCLVYAVVCGSVASVALLFGSPFLARFILRDMRTLPSLRFLAIGLTPLALSSVFSGYFIAVRRPSRNAAIQVTEQWVKIALTVFLLSRMMPYGVTWACVALVLGGMIGEMLSCVVLGISSLVDYRRHPLTKLPIELRKKSGYKPLLEIAVPIASGAYVRSALLTVEHMLIPWALAVSGSGKETALASYAALHSMALPIVAYPMALLSSFAGLLVPEYTESLVRDEKRRLKHMTRESYSTTFAFALGVALVLLLLGDDIGQCLYGSSEAGTFIRLLAPLVPLMYLDHVTDAMLKGMGLQLYVMIINVLDSLLSIVLVMLLLPRLGALGYVWVILIAEAFNFICSYIGMRKKIGEGLSWRIFLRPLPAIAVTGIFMKMFEFGAVKDGIGLTLRLCLFFGLYMFSLFVFDLLFKKENNSKRIENNAEKEEKTSKLSLRCGFSMKNLQGQ